MEPVIKVILIQGLETFVAIRKQTFKVFIVTPPLISTRKLLSLPGKNFVEYSHDTVRIIFSDPVQHSVLFQKDSFSLLRTTNDKTLIFPVPSEMYGVSGNLFITIYQSDVIVETTSVYLIGRSYCRLDDCIICMDAIINARCLPYTHSVFLLVIISVSVCLLFAVFFFFARYFLSPLYHFLMFFMACCMCCKRDTRIQRTASRKIAKIRNNVAYWLSPDKEESVNGSPRVERGSDTESENSSASAPRASKSPATLVLGLVLLSLPFILSTPTPISSLHKLPGLDFAGSILDECRDGVTIPSTSTTCVHLTPSTQKCTVNFDVIATVPHTQTGACITIVDTNTHHMVDFRVFYVALEHIWTTGNCYKASSFDFHSQANRPCSNPLNPTICPNGCGIADRTGHGTLTNPLVTSYSGETDCYRTCGSALCGCWLSLDSCMYYGWSVIGKAPFYEVCETIKQELRPIVILAVISGASLVEFATLDGDTHKTMSNITFSPIGTFQGDPIDLGDNRFITNLADSTHSLGRASKLNQPILGTLGEIQANTVAELTQAGQHIRYAEHLVDIKRERMEVFFRPTRPHADNYHTEPTTYPIPGMYVGNIFEVGPASGQFYTNATHAPGFQFKLSTTSPYTFTREVTTVCPQAVYWTGGGYRKSPKGVTLLFNMTSSCLAGMSSVTVNGDVDLWTHSVILTDVLTTIAVKLGTAKEANSITVNFVGSGGTVSLPVSFTAIADTTVTLPDGRNVTTDVPETSGGASVLDWLAKLLDSFIKGDLNWVVWIIVGLSITGAIILAIGITAGTIVFVVSVAAPALAPMLGPLLTISKFLPMFTPDKAKSN